MTHHDEELVRTVFTRALVAIWLVVVAWLLLDAACARAADLPLYWTNPCTNARADSCAYSDTTTLTDLGRIELVVRRFSDGDTFMVSKPLVGRECQDDSLLLDIAPGTTGEIVAHVYDKVGNVSCAYNTFVFAIPAEAVPANTYQFYEANDALERWQYIVGTGVEIPFTGDDQNRGPYALPFRFPFYGLSMFDSVRVCTNGWLSFTATTSSPSNTALPSATAPANLIAPYWDDLDFRTSGDAYFYADSSKAVVAWIGVPRLGGGGTYTFQVILWVTGEIDILYYSITGNLTSETVGIQDGTRTNGLTLAHNVAYPRSGLRVRLWR